MADKEKIDQDALAAEWGVAMEEETAAPAVVVSGPIATPGTDEAAAQWAAMVETNNEGTQAAKGGGAERILNQDEIDSMLGFSLTDVSAERQFRHPLHYRLRDGVLRALADA